jgi:hypothetical protein
MMDVRRLRDFQIVALQLRDVQVACRIVAVGGDEAVLEPQHPGALGAVTLPARATVSFETEQHPVMLAGMAGDGPVLGSVAFWVTDAVGQRELRLQPRLNAAFEVRLRPADGRGFPFTGQTIDLSAGGVLVGGLAAEPGVLFELQLAVPALPRPIACGAEVVRRLPSGSALEFRGLDAATQRTLGQLIFSVRQQVARRAFRQAA